MARGRIAADPSAVLPAQAPSFIGREGLRLSKAVSVLIVALTCSARSVWPATLSEPLLWLTSRTWELQSRMSHNCQNEPSESVEQANQPRLCANGCGFFA